jgi:hypothetical protein
VQQPEERGRGGVDGDASCAGRHTVTVARNPVIRDTIDFAGGFQEVAAGPGPVDAATPRGRYRPVSRVRSR